MFHSLESLLGGVLRVEKGFIAIHTDSSTAALFAFKVIEFLPLIPFGYCVAVDVFGLQSIMLFRF